MLSQFWNNENNLWYVIHKIIEAEQIKKIVGL